MNVQRGVQMIIKQPNGKYCEMNHEGECLGFNGEYSFKVIYTLYGEEKVINNYELTDYNGNRISLNTLNGYQRGVVLNDCMAYFTGGKYHSDSNSPCGVIKIEESEVK